MRLKALKAAFPHTIPIMAGFLFLGMTYGVTMQVKGFPFYYPMLTSLMIYAGSMEFVTSNLLLGVFDPLQAFLMTLMVNARHLFYGLALLDRFPGKGLRKAYMIFGLTDETFSIACAVEPPPEVDKSQFQFFVTFLNQCYWVTGATLGGLAGMLLKFNTQGLDFAMTAMFVVIFIEQWKKDKNHAPALSGLLISVICLILWGADGFVIPAMAGILLCLMAIKKPMEGVTP